MKIVKGDPGLAGLCLLFVLLKLLGFFEWSWWWVWCPLFINVGTGVITTVLTIITRREN